MKFNKEIKFMIFLLVLLLIVLSIIIIAVLKIRKDNVECMVDPLVYGAKKLKNLNDEEVLCYCVMMGANDQRLMFNSEKKWMEDYF